MHACCFFAGKPLSFPVELLRGDDFDPTKGGACRSWQMPKDAGYAERVWIFRRTQKHVSNKRMGIHDIWLVVSNFFIFHNVWDNPSH